MKKLIIFYLFVTFITINCSDSLSGIYFPADDNNEAKKEFIEKIEFSPPTKMIIYYKENTEGLKKAQSEFADISKYSNQQLSESYKQLLGLFKARELPLDCKKDGNVIYIYARNILGTEKIIGVFDIKDKMLIGRKGYDYVGVYKKVK